MQSEWASSRCTSCTVAVVGDVMLDIDLEGSATRLSPEAPVPVVDTEWVWHRPGGAGLAALLAARHEGNVVLVTGISDDASRLRLRELLGNNGVRSDMPMTGSTVTKTRVRARGQRCCASTTATVHRLPVHCPSRSPMCSPRRVECASPTTAAG